jgi:hypothetical protein
MNIREIAEQQPELLAAILAASSGPLGEILVARALQRLGCEVCVLSNNWRQRDLRVITPDGRELFVETKTVRGRNSPWIINTPPDPARSQVWVLVYAPRAPDTLPQEEDVRFFVLTAEEALEAWKRSPPASPNAQIKGDIRWSNLPADCEGAFHKLTTVHLPEP